ncbi:hypothetical protein ACHAXT_001639 [Thalassiosira profunda]
MSWHAPLAKLAGLLVLVPFALAYLHLYYYTYWKSEYCLVGPHVSLVSGRPYGELMGGGENSVEDDNRLRGDATTDGQDNQASGIAQYYGIYAPIPQNKKKKKGNNNDPRQFRQIYTPSQSSRWFWSRGWPSVTEAATLVSSPSSTLSNHKSARMQQHATNNADHIMALAENEGEKRWCLSTGGSPDSHIWCSDPLPGPAEGATYPNPPSGVWQAQRTPEPTSKIAPSLLISCPTPAVSTTEKNNSRHKQQNAKQNQNLQFLLNRPATALLLLLNTGLAFYYWNHRVSPSSVCKQYTKIVIDNEWWRGFTGATAHFEPLHIGFNMMSLNTLGRELEGGFGSITFLVYNVALVVFTTAVMMAMVYARLLWIQRQLDRTNNPQMQQSLQEQQQRLRETSTVGYSAVLFAWMVVSTMERNQATCPVPFFSDLCFETYTMPGMPFLKFNLSPIVSLFVAQFIMPRVSFMGHLAGIVCGFLLHWGLILPLEVCSPNVLIGGVFLAGLIWRTRMIPLRPLLTAMLDEEGCVEHETYLRSLLTNGGEEGDSDNSNTSLDPFARGRQRKNERELEELQRKQRTLLYVRNLLGALAAASLFVFDWGSSLVLSQVILLAYFTFASQSSSIVWAYTRSKVESDIIEPERVRAGVIWRGFFMSAVLSIILDAMSMASWFVIPTLLAAEQTPVPVGLFLAAAFTTIRITISVFGLVLSSKILHDIGVGGGIFAQVFSGVIQWSKLLGDYAAFISHRPLWTAFEGRGIALGRRQS